MKLKNFSLATAQDGALVERFDVALKQVIKNIDDVNTSATEKREITLKVIIAPDKNREAARFAAKVTTKLAAPEGLNGTMFMGRKGDNYFAFERDPSQLTFDDVEEEEGIVVEDKLEDIDD